MSGERQRPRRRRELSQHFLRSGALAADLVARTSISSDDLVVEIGPGRGALTAALTARCRELVAVEIDARLCEELRARFRGAAHVAIVCGDFLRHPLPRSPYKVFGSIPFARTAEIVERVTHASTAPDDAYLIVQREAAERFAGGPYAPETLRSLSLKPYWHVEIVRRLRRTDFDPPPVVDSVVLWLARRPRPLVDPTHQREYRRFIAEAFGRHGRTIDRCLRLEFTRRQIGRLSRDLRFETSWPPSRLSFDQWLGLFRFSALKGGRQDRPIGSRIHEAQDTEPEIIDTSC